MKIIWGFFKMGDFAVDFIDGFSVVVVELDLKES